MPLERVRKQVGPWPGSRISAVTTECQLNKTLFDVVSVFADTSAMSNTSSIPLPAAQALRQLGRDLALARRKRGISTSDMAARLFVSRDTLWRLERGDPTVALGTSTFFLVC